MRNTEQASQTREPWRLARWEIAIMSAIFLTGLVLRIRLSLDTYLNPDEASHALHSFGTVPQMFHYSLDDNHPPLLLLLTHVVLKIHRSDLAARLIPIISGSLFPLVLAIWLRRVAGSVAAITAMFLLTFSPHLVVVSAQLRSYPLALLLLSASLIALDAGIDSGRWQMMIGFDFLLLASIFTDYSMAWFAGAAGIYGLMRIRRSPAAVKIAWISGQAAALLFYGVVFTTNVRQAFTNGAAEDARINWLRRGFPHPGSMLAFPLTATLGQFEYLMASKPLGVVAWAMFAAAVILLWTGRTRIKREKARAIAVLLTVPFVLALAGAYAGVFPYGHSRHTLVVGLFAACGLGILLESLPRRARMAIPVAGALAVAIWLWVPGRDPGDPELGPDRNRKSQMVACIDYMHANIPAGALIFMERSTLQMLMYYEGAVQPPGTETGRFREVVLAGRWRVAWRDYEYGTRAEYRDALAAFRAQYGMPAPEPVWVVDGGWSTVSAPVDRRRPFTRAVRVHQIQ